MPVGRRFLLPTAFMGLAILLGHASSSLGQQSREPPHVIWNSTLTPEQIKAALSKLAIGGNENDPLQKMLGDQLEKQYPGLPREFLDAAIKKAITNPSFIEKAKQFAKEKQVDPGLRTQAESGRSRQAGQDDASRYRHQETAAERQTAQRLEEPAQYEAAGRSQGPDWKRASGRSDAGPSPAGSCGRSEQPDESRANESRRTGATQDPRRFVVPAAR